MWGAGMSDSNEYSLRAPFPHPANWKVRRLRDVCSKIGSGATPTGGQANYLPSRENWALVRSQNVFDRRFDETGLAFITDEQAATLGGVVLQSEDVLLNITGDGVTFARSCQIPESALPAVVNQHVSIVRPKPDLLNPGFLLAYLTHPETKHYIEGFNAGGSRRAITKGHIEAFNIPLPPLQIQQDIAHILGTLDDKIELNRRTNETLEAMARAIFKSWFVDFDPVRAKASGEPPESICRRLGLTPEILALFPDALQDSELGEIPTGWSASSLGELTGYLNRGVSPKYLEQGGVLVLNQKCVRNGKVNIASARRHDPLQRAITGRELCVGDILVNSTGVGTLGRVAQLLALEEPAIVDSHVTVVRANTAVCSPSYLYMALAYRQSEIEALGEGSTGQTELSRARLAALKILAPPKGLMAYFETRVKALRQASSNNDGQNRRLVDLRDALLPKLLSGDMPIPAAESALQCEGA